VQFLGTCRSLALLGAAIFAISLAAPKASPRPQDEAIHSLPSGVSIAVPGTWIATKSDLDSPPELLAGSAPPVHFTEVLLLEDAQDASVLLLAASNNPLVGHDEYWLDTQMHSPKDSPMSLPNFLFYLFFPPPSGCLTGAEESYTGAGRASTEEGEAPDLEVYLTCEFAPTLPNFYAAQISTSIVLRKKEDKLWALAVLNDFYLTPMEVVDSAGFTFYVFEAKGSKRVTAGDAAFFQLPDTVEGSQPDFFWAVGAETPFPFTRERARASSPIIHLAYAGLGSSERTEFLRLLRTVRRP